MSPETVERLKEPSTWRGIIMLLTAAGVPILPLQAETIITIGITVSGLVGVFTSDKTK
jgi:hypothetical protein